MTGAADPPDRLPVHPPGASPLDGLARYLSASAVRAGEIVAVAPDGCDVRRADGRLDRRLFVPGMTARYMPVPGDFWVAHEPDGFLRVWARWAFLEHYAPAPPGLALRPLHP